MDLISQNRCFGGTQSVYSHASDVCATDMTFAVFLPPEAKNRPVPVLWYLSGLTCTHENAMVKAGLQAHAAKHGIAIVFPDTSPRGETVGNDDAYDLGQGAGFYLNATQDPWKPHFQMYDYIIDELPQLIESELPINGDRGITGHSMGGHGALTLAIRNPQAFRSVSAFSPITNPTKSNWGRKQFVAYLGPDETTWANHDATRLLAKNGFPGDILIDQGADDEFYDKLGTDAFAQAAAARAQPATIRIHEGYDHSYFFVSSFAEDHVAWHAERLKQKA